jgi:sialidase-1
MHQQLDRRSVLGLGIGLPLAGSLLSQEARSNGGIELLDLRVISWQKAHYHGWPTLVRREAGELLLVYSGGREQHVCPFGRVEMMRSKDNGATWSWPQVLSDGAIDDRDAGVVETASGAILVTTFTSLAYEAILKRMSEAHSPDQQVMESWSAVHERLSAEQRKGELGCYMFRSTDGGITWGARYCVPLNSPHGPVALRDGRVLYAGKALWQDDRVGFCQSADDGLTWQWMSTITPRPGDDPKNYHELHAVEAGDGTLVCHVRNHNAPNAQETLQCESTDGGHTWSVPYAIGVWGLPSHLLKLRDGRLLMSYE